MTKCRSRNYVSARGPSCWDQTEPQRGAAADCRKINSKNLHSCANEAQHAAPASARPAPRGHCCGCCSMTRGACWGSGSAEAGAAPQSGRPTAAASAATAGCGRPASGHSTPSSAAHAGAAPRSSAFTPVIAATHTCQACHLGQKKLSQNEKTIISKCRHHSSFSTAASRLIPCQASPPPDQRAQPSRLPTKSGRTQNGSKQRRTTLQ